MKRIMIYVAMIVLSAFQFAEAEVLIGGLIWKDPRKVAPKNEVKPTVAKFYSLPFAVDHSAEMPPVIQQAGGSCVAVSTVYYYKTHQEWMEHGWSLAEPTHQFNPYFVYWQINDGGDNGCWYGDALQFLCDRGSNLMSQSDLQTEASFDTAINYRSEDWHWFEVSNDTGIVAMKQRLAYGDNLIIGVNCFPNFTGIIQYDTVFCLADTVTCGVAGHGICVVGYDDNRATHDGPGAFRIVNSWGTGWGNQGYGWISYEAMKNARATWQTAFYSDDKIGYIPTLKMRMKINHINEGEVLVRAGIGPTYAPLWVKDFSYNSLYDYSYVSGASFPDNNIVLDLTDGESCLDSNSVNNIFLECCDNMADGFTGVVEYLSVEYLDWGTNVVSFNTPNIIPDYHVNTFTDVPFRYKYFNTLVTPDVQCIASGQSAVYKIKLTSFNEYADNVTLDASISPIPAQGDFDIVFDKSPVIPTDSCNMTVQSSSDIAYGCYDIVLKGSDALNTQFVIAKVKLWILGSGQALCLGVSDSMLNLVKNVWSLVDTFSAMPPVLDSNYQAVIIEDGAAPNDTSILRTYIQNGGNVMMTGHAPLDLCGSANLTPISSWLGATLYNVYIGSGMKIVSDYTQPFGVATINTGDTLGVALYGFSRLSTLTIGAIRLAHLGTVTSVIAGLTNSYGLGHSFWYMGSAGLSLKSDSLIKGYLINPEIGTKTQVAENFDGSSNKLYLGCFPNPVKIKANISFAVPIKSQVKVVVYDILGRRVRTLLEETKEPGKYSITWNGKDNFGKDVVSGIYFIRLETDADNMIKKIIYLK